MLRPPSDPDYLRMPQQADEARGDFAATLDELDFVKRRLSRLSALAALSAKAAPDQQYGCGSPRPDLRAGRPSLGEGSHHSLWRDWRGEW